MSFKRSSIRTILFYLLASSSSGLLASELGEQVQVDVNRPITEQLKEYYKNLNTSHVPSGILLESGAVLNSTTALKNNELNQQGLNQDQFNDTYADLMRGKLIPESNPKNLYSLGSKIRDGHVYPMSLAFVRYDSIPLDVLEQHQNDGNHFIPNGNRQVGVSKKFIAATIQAPAVYGNQVQLVLNSNLLLNHGAQSIGNFEFIYNGQRKPITLNSPFTVNIATPIVRKSKPQLASRNTREFELRFVADGVRYTAKGKFNWADPLANLRQRRSGMPVCYDMPTVTASRPFNGQTSKLNIRIYPANGSVSGSGTNGAGCINGSQPELKQVMVILDGFDPGGNRTQESIYEDFGESMDQFVAAGFDLVVVDYKNGRDYIQRNGLAVRELLVNKIPGWLASNADTRVVLTAGSMGTQTGRYAMTTAERAGEDHNVRLFFAIDGPFRGANIPISIQAFVEFFAPMSPAAENNLAGLNSPAASQQLLLNRYYHSGGPNPSPMRSNRWYLPRPEYYQYYNEVNALGLPQLSRNIGIASGSGTGSALSPHLNYKQTFNHVNWSSLWGTFIIRSTTRTDHAGEVFEGRVKLPIVCHYLGSYCNQRVRLSLNNPKKLDIAPSGYRTSPVDIKNDWNNSSDTKGTMTSPFYYHGFVPTFSALNIPTSNLYYNPSRDSSALGRSGFDAVWYEKCNKEHVARTDGMWELISVELQAFLTNTVPAEVELPRTGCGRVEPNTPVAKCDVSERDQGSGNVVFNGSRSYHGNPNANIVSYIWNPGDGNRNLTGKVRSYQYSAPPQGTYYTPTLTVIDDSGKSSTDTCRRVYVGIYQ
ncbi:PKD domain-containing protein [Shewanella corallii]|uniref:PKD domain-containing protein n=1 Tax=Shewanella corallii TaxID=560080 RepID=A0ABT0N2A7_9GAMM|nr:PKD domain-containing protein [Shewanella corallii]MCL2912568.1 PKD domain-containing protein [Shewanella corallii]